MFGPDFNPARRESDFEFIPNSGIEFGEHFIRQKTPRRFANLYDLQCGDHPRTLEECGGNGNVNWVEIGLSSGVGATVSVIPAFHCGHQLLERDSTAIVDNLTTAIGSVLTMAEGDGPLNLHPAAPPRLALPALNWHQAWWFPDSEDGSRSSSAKTTLARTMQQLVRDCIDDSKLNIVKVDGCAIQNSSEYELLNFAGQKIPDDATAMDSNLGGVDVFSISLDWEGCPVRLHIAIHSEYFTITLWSMFVRKSAESRSFPLQAQRVKCQESKYWEHFGPLYDLVDGAAKMAPEFPFRRPQRPEDNTIKAASDALYDDHMAELWTALFPGGHDNELKKYNKFADFRSILLTSDLHLDGEVPTQDRFIRNPGAALDAMAAIFNASKSSDQSSLPELMGSLFLNGRVAYVSSLDPHYNGHSERQGVTQSLPSAQPVRYLMYADDVCRWQMGRLVERLNQLGTFRLASVRDEMSLNLISDKLRSIGQALDKLDMSDRAAVNATYVKEYSNFNNLAKSAESELLRRDGITYRIERSRFYVTAFNRLVGELRNKDVQGFQSYPDFVRRRYGAKWDRIDRIGIRYERLAKRLDYLSNYQQASEFARNADSQKRLLRTAERLSVIPIAHYGKEETAHLLSSVPFLECLEPVAFFVNVALFSIVMLGIFVWHRLRSSSAETKTENGDGRFWFLVLIMAITLSWVMITPIP